MALAHAMLTVLSGKPLSGYDLAKTFKTSIGFFWHASPQQIYAELRRLESKELIKGRRHSQDKYPDKIIWSITVAGQEELASFIAASSKPASIKDDLSVKVYALDIENAHEIRTQLIERLQYHQERLSLFRKIEKNLDRNGHENPDTAGRYIGLRSGLLYEQSRIDWCMEAIAHIERLTESEGQSGSV